MTGFVFLAVALLFTMGFANLEEDHVKEGEDHGKDQQPKEPLPGHKMCQYIPGGSFDLYWQTALAHPSENIVISPFSISAALGLLSLGHKGHNCSKILEGRGTTSNQEIHEGFHNPGGREPQLSTGNVLFISKHHNISQTFLDDAKKFYKAEVISTDFTNKDDVKNKINSYMEKKTQGKISETLHSIDEDTIVILINYIDFQVKSESGCVGQSIEDFYVNETTSVKVPYMTRTGMYNVTSTDEVTVVSIPYSGDVSALYIMPSKGKLSEIEEKLNEETVQKWENTMEMRSLELSIPNISVSFVLDLKKKLIKSKRGTEKVIPNNLSDISEEKPKYQAVHVASLTVQDKGAEETAGSTGQGGDPKISSPTLISFNRPFVFTILAKKSLLFTRIIKPTK
ncbi:alpha-1-antiproteinase-like [Leptodactylus fuscus]|uniref:alpha-1-antiproteinase-like n=1 Tax=Leptodactylus fuscus TaxID=238119 RepID=UPI003F4F04D3